jgi:hypothetical protein
MGKTARRKSKPDPARESLARAHVGGPLTPEERARIEAIRARGPVASVPHESIMRQLDERKRRV